MVRWHSVYLGKPPVRHITALRLSSRKRRSLVKQACKAWRAGGHSHRRSPVLHTDWINSSSSTAQGPAPRTCAVARTQASVTHADFFGAALRVLAAPARESREDRRANLISWGKVYRMPSDRTSPVLLLFASVCGDATAHRIDGCTRSSAVY